MYHDFIDDFQYNLYKLLSNDPEIKLKIDKIYLSVVQDAKYPFLIINILKADNMSVVKQNIAKVEFEICIFTNDKNRDISSKLADKIIKIIAEYSFELRNSVLAGIKAGKIEFCSSKDLVSTKLVISYQALLKQKIIHE